MLKHAESVNQQHLELLDAGWSNFRKPSERKTTERASLVLVAQQSPCQWSQLQLVKPKSLGFVRCSSGFYLFWGSRLLIFQS